MRRRRFLLAVGIPVVVYLVGMAVVFALLAAQSRDFARTAHRTQGTVVKLVPRAPLGSTREPPAGARTPSLAPEVSYVVEGRTYSYVAAHGQYRQRLQVGDKVTVLYSPSDPTAARLRGEGQNLGPLLSVGFGLSAVLVALVLIRLRRRLVAPRPRPGSPRVGRPASALVAD